MGLKLAKRKIFVPLLITLAFILSFILFTLFISKENLGEILHQPDTTFIENIEKNIKVTLQPEFQYSYSNFEKGVIQHLDRNYTYDVIPEEMQGGILFQGIHRPPQGTSVTIELEESQIVYFFFHNIFDGGYTDIFKKLPKWKLQPFAPKYDIHNGDHGHSMVLYKANLPEGKYAIPPTTEDKACFSIVFRSTE